MQNPSKLDLDMLRQQALRTRASIIYRQQADQLGDPLPIKAPPVVPRRDPVPYMLIGSVVLGARSEKWGGRRGAATLGVVLGLLAAPLFLFSSSPWALMLGAWLIGFFASGAWGIVPGYLSERFPTEARGVGTGFSYHVGVGLGAYTPYLIGALQDSGTDLRTAMFWCTLGGTVIVVTLLWLGPETRGRQLH